jgi:Novel STAND NTPase 1
MINEKDSKPSPRERMRSFCDAFMKERKLATERHFGIPVAGEIGPAAPAEEKYGFLLPSTRPYPGLRAFTPGEARIFFGRLKEAGELRKRLADNNVVVVLGGSGSGKSSLVLAGVLPRLNDVGRIPGRTGRWYAASFRPGDNPCQRMVDALWDDVCLPLLALKQGPQAFDEILGGAPTGAEQEHHVSHAELRDCLETVIQPDGKVTVRGLNAFLAKLDEIDARIADLRGSSRSGGINLLLLIDQFEELFRDTVKNEKKEDVKTIVDLLNHARDHREEPLVVVVTLRSEELHRCTEVDGLAPAVNSGFYLIDRPNIEALDSATVEPGRQTLLDWGVVTRNAKTGNAASENTAEDLNTPFSTQFMEKLKDWIKDFQDNEFVAPASTERRKRHQADLLPLFQHLLRITWTAAVERWATEDPEKATVELADIEEWISARSKRVGQLRDWIRASSTATEPEFPATPDNMLEKCFDTAFAITLSEAITGKRWDELPVWPQSDEKMLRRLHLIQAALVALATRDDKGNDARRPASAGEILAASHEKANDEELKNILSFFKHRDYLQGGDKGERYDVSHEALIRNSSEYQAWLADAKDVTDALTLAKAVLYAGRTDAIKPELAANHTAGGRIWRSLRRAIGNVLAPKKIWATYFLTDLRDAGARFSESLSRELERTFGARAVFSPAWMSERAQLGKTANEQKRTCENIEEIWTKAYRWHVDIDAETKDEKPYLGSDFVKAFRNLWSGPDSHSAPLPGRTLRAFRLSALGNLLITLFVIFPLLGAASHFYVRPLQQKVRLFSEYAANNQTSDFRLKLLLLASVLRDSGTWLGTMALLDASDLQQKTREVLLRSPVFGGTFASAAWDEDGTRVVAIKPKNDSLKKNDSLPKNDSLIVYNLLDEKDGKPLPKQGEPSSLSAATDEPEIAPPPSIGFFKQEDGSEGVAAFRIASGSVWTGKEGSPLEKKFPLPKTAQAPGQWIPRADISKDHIRIIFLGFADSAINKMNILDLKASDRASWEEKAKNKESISWEPLDRQAFQQPVLAEDCGAYAFLGRVVNAEKPDVTKKPDATNLNPNETKPLFKLWLGEAGTEIKQPETEIKEPKKDIQQISLDGLYLKGAVAISRHCKSAVARNDSEQGKQQLYLVPFADGQAASKPVAIPLDFLNEDFANGSYPVGLQQQAELAAAPGGKTSKYTWRVGWPTRVGLALLDVSVDKDGAYHAKPAVPGPDRWLAFAGSDQRQVVSAPEPKPALSELDQKQMLTGLEGGYDSGSLSLSPDGSRALLIRQDSFASPIRVRAFNLDFVGQWKKFSKGTDELVREACRIATMQDGSNELKREELNTWLKDENAPQPCDGYGLVRREVSPK